jgi:hypothetical protein
MRRCDGDDVRTRYIAVHICIAQAKGSFCQVLDGLALRDGSVCTSPCTEEVACTTDLQNSCHDYQYRYCRPGATGAAGEPG